MMKRLVLTYAGLFVLILLVGATQGATNILLLLVTSAAYALIALGLNIQYGYGGLFNFAIMGMLMVGAMGLTSISYPLNDAFWQSDGPMLLGHAIGAAIVGAAVIILAHNLPRWGVSRRLTNWAKFIAWFGAYIFYRTQIDPAAHYIEAKSGWVGGLGLPIWLGIAAGGVLAGLAAYVIGKISLGLRSDYLAIATIGMSEIIRAFVKNMDWLTRGTLTVTPMPWPVPRPEDYQAAGLDTTLAFIMARGGFLLLMVLVLAIVIFLIEQAYRGPWGRMMRAIRDNDEAAAAMGKNVKSRQVEIFVFGAVLMGIGGAILASFSQIFDPSGYQPINHTFLVWVMVIVGGIGNSFGTLFGGVFIYLVWALSDPISHALFDQANQISTHFGWGAIPAVDVRASQMRVFVLGLVITLALRYAPKGLIPEVIGRHKD
jgi:branched-chain amino acid transport system permease protein